jgi:hypothetical protein
VPLGFSAGFVVAIAATVAFATGCVGSSVLRTVPPTPRAIRYTFSTSPDLATLTATVCPEQGMPAALVASHDDGRARIETAEALLEGGATRPLPHEGRIDLREVPVGACVRYRVDLAPRPRDSSAVPGTYRVGADLVAPTTAWLWAPEPRDPATELYARFVLPKGLRVSTVWPEAEGGWLRLDERAFRYLAYVAFGRFEVERIGVPGGCIEAAVLDGPLVADGPARARWLSSAGRAVSRILGRFPAERVGVIVVPVPFADDPVVFGTVGRGVLPTVALFTGTNASSEALRSDWVAVHEFAHLVSPCVESAEAWITEGLATYYQHVLLARERLITVDEAWNRLLSGFARGRTEGTGRTLAEESREMMRTYAFRRVYWAGAAIAMIADVEYRRRSNGEDSLDHAMIRAASRRHETLSARELIEALDGGRGGVFAEVADRSIHSTEFPPVEETLAFLGVRKGATGIERLEDAPGATIREAIMNGLEPSASNPFECE